ncbi:adhesin [Deinococcus irradiatisoli]|uniref:Adhesin n=1 Tax=Deinococcus irradiatisoli TaxID=2202254 RepID=A0A2Z3JHS9_9DEIO|nr:zinc ABC transporter substrate-binding protein [Deinococcus irradiatisoli]AWN23556.1 adhesin [Deinococcus irradiatisoli]
MTSRSFRLSSALLGAALLGTSASALSVSASNTLVADWVGAIGGARVSVTTLIPANADPHDYQPSPRDIAGLSGSKALFVSGAGLETWLPKVRGAAARVPVVELSGAPSVKLRQVGSGTDPHTWWNPINVQQFVKLIAQQLSRLDPAGKTLYTRNLAAYQQQLTALDAYARKQFSALPPARRLLVTNHDSLGYLAGRYSLTIVGDVIPGLSSEREPSARELAALTDAIRRSGAPAIFTENTVNPRLARTLSQETGARIAPPLYTDALGPQGSSGATYLKAFRSNVDTIVGALK